MCLSYSDLSIFPCYLTHDKPKSACGFITASDVGTSGSVVSLQSFVIRFPRGLTYLNHW